LAGNITDQVTTLAQTTNAVATTILTYSHPDNSAQYSKAFVTAYDGSGNVKAWEMALTSKRVSGAAVSLVGTLQSLITAQGDVALATVVAIMTNSGNDIIVQATGIALTTINWRVRFIADIHTP